MWRNVIEAAQSLALSILVPPAGWLGLHGDGDLIKFKARFHSCVCSGCALYLSVSEWRSECGA